MGAGVVLCSSSWLCFFGFWSKSPSGRQLLAVLGLIWGLSADVLHILVSHRRGHLCIAQTQHGAGRSCSSFSAQSGICHPLPGCKGHGD